MISAFRWWTIITFLASIYFAINNEMNTNTIMTPAIKMKVLDEFSLSSSIPLIISKVFAVLLSGVIGFWADFLSITTLTLGLKLVVEWVMISRPEVPVILPLRFVEIEDGYWAADVVPWNEEVAPFV
jgi:hypothetical protein